MSVLVTNTTGSVGGEMAKRETEKEKKNMGTSQVQHIEKLPLRLVQAGINKCGHKCLMMEV